MINQLFSQTTTFIYSGILGLVFSSAFLTILVIYTLGWFYLLPSMGFLIAQYPIYLVTRKQMTIQLQKLSSAILTWKPEDETNGTETTQEELAIYYHSSQRVIREIDWVITTPLIFGIILGLTIYAFLTDVPMSLRLYGLYMTSQVVFHLGEFMLVCFYHYEDLGFQSYLINHSPQFKLAMIFTQVEFLFFYILSGDSVWWSFSIIGFCLSIIGHFFRIGAFISAKSNFHHLVQRRKSTKHQLVTTGVYAFTRHPSYFGFFIQVVGGQLLINNFIATIAFTAVVWKFFYDRIFDEEYYLVKFFGQDYIRYRDIVGTGIPFMDMMQTRLRNKT